MKRVDKPLFLVLPMAIHSTSIISGAACIAADVEIGPFCVIEDEVTIAAGCSLSSHIVIKRGTTLGRNNRIDVGAVLGGYPQHLGAGKEVGTVSIGDDNWIREFVTIHRGYQPNSETRVGNSNMLMASSHIGHDCVVGHHNILANSVMLGGHVAMGDRNYLGGGSALHQFCRVGSYSMVGGLARITRDIPPFVLVDGSTACMVGLNTIGLRRAGMSPQDRRELKAAYRLAFRDTAPLEAKLERLRAEFPHDPGKSLWEFLEGSQRGFLQDRRQKNHSAESGTNGSSSTAKDPQESQVNQANSTVTKLRPAA